GRRSSHDALRSEIVTTTQGKVGAVTTAGRVHMVDVVDLPALPPAATRPNVAGGVKIAEYAALEKNEKILGLIDLDQEFVVGLAPPQGIDDSLAVVVTSNAQLLAFDAAGLRAQGWNASGVAGIKVAAEAQVIFFGMTPKAAKTDEEGDADAELGSFAVVTIATGENFYGAPPSSIKVSESPKFPTKGRPTSGCRGPKFPKAEPDLSRGWAATSRKAAPSGAGSRRWRRERGHSKGSGPPLEP